MLKFFSRLERTRNFVLLIIALLLVASLVFFYAPSQNPNQFNLTNSTETAATVGGEKITVGEVATLQQSISQGGRTFPANLLIDSMVRERMVRVEAAKLGLTASDAEVAKYIREQFKSPDGRPFNQQSYEQTATQQAGSVKAFEQGVRDELSGQKLQAYITSGVSASEEELLDIFKRRNTKFDLSFVPVSAEQLTAAIKPTDEELKAFFEQNKNDYRISVPQKKIRYVFINTAKIGEKLNISEEDLKAEYDKLPAERKQAGVQGQQIVLRIPRPEQEQQILTKANQLVEQARKDGGKISAEAFADIARGQSEDPATAQNGGNLRGLVRPNPTNPNDPYQRLLTMQPGEVSDPIKFGTAYYILRRGEAVPKSFEDAKKEIEVSLRNRRSYTAASELAQKVVESLKQTKDVQKTAAEFAAQANNSVTEMVRETDYVKPGDDVPNVGISPQFEDGILPLETVGDVGERTPIKDGFAIPMLVDKREPRDATFEEVKNQVAEAYKAKIATERTEQIAKEIAASATGASDLAKLAEAKGLKPEDAKNFILGSPLGQGVSAATSEALEKAISGLKVGEVTKTPVKVGDSYYIVGVTNRTEPNMDEFAKQRDQIAQGILAERRGQVFSDYLAAVRKRMEDAGQIKIYKDVIEKIDATATPEQPVQ